jgi:hypothetical protein
MLEEAATQISKETGSGARLGLILLDNLAEVMMYDRARLLFAQDGRFEGVIPRKYPEPVRKKVLRNFPDKVEFFVHATNDLTEDQGKVLIAGHVLRNEAYHKGVVREAIIQQVARACLEAACTVLPHFVSGVIMIPAGEDVGEYFKRYGVEACIGELPKAIEQLCQEFREKLPCPPEGLAQALSADLVRRIEQIEFGLDYLTDASNERVSTEEVLKGIQFNPSFHQEHTFSNTDEGFRQFMEVREREYAVYVPPVFLKTVDEWKSQAIRIGSIAAPGEALTLYLQLENKMADIEDAVREAVYEFDEWVNMEVHDRRL